MIIQETITVNGKTYYHAYSDAGYMIHGGNPAGDYAEALDAVQTAYTETTTPVAEEEEPECTDADYAEAGRILLGVTDTGDDNGES